MNMEAGCKMHDAGTGVFSTTTTNVTKIMTKIAVPRVHRSHLHTN